MKRFLSWFRRRLLVRLTVQRGLVLRPGDTVVIGVDRDWLARFDFEELQARLEERHAGVKFLYVADLGRIFLLGGSGCEECGNDRKSGRE
ncbi:hypothetical protein [Burkholderia vietnamiensis]|uniref:hypothetical protein n=1 Tax=Burkholderia vietnamiensis TaxID=60552 RepID=UPI0012DB14FB|nr:hypothetical protein [Burkholderia vietnamiensis]